MIILAKIVIMLTGIGCFFGTGYYYAAKKLRNENLDTLGFINWLTCSVIYTVIMFGMIL